MTPDRWSINVVDVQTDLTAGKGRPQWILSTYGPGKNSPVSLLDGTELSFEELRLRFYELKADGSEMQATNEASGLWSKAEQQMAEVLNNIDQVGRFMEEAEKNHPNRYDFLKMTGAISKDQVVKEAGSSSPFGGTSGTKPAGFGASATGFGSAIGSTNTAGFGSGASQVSSALTGTFGQPTPSSGFGAPSFGQSSQPAFSQTGFGQPSTTLAFGKPAGGAFGQPSSPGQSSQTSGFGTSGFGQPAAKNPFAAPPAATFGQASKPAMTFGQPSQPTSGFGQPSQPGGFGQSSQLSSGFGQASQLGSGFGQPSKPASGFGQPAQPSSGFGQSSQPTSSFGQPSNPVSGFGQPSQPAAGFGQTPQRTSSFGQLSQSTSGFGQLPQPKPAFGQSSQPTSAFGQPSRSTSGFGQPSQSDTANQAVSSFGQPPPSQPTERKTSNPFGNRASSTKTFTQPSQPGPSTGTDPLNPFTTHSSSTAPTLVNSPTLAPFTATNSTATTTTSTTNPHPLTSKPPAPTHYTQTLPPGRTQHQSNIPSTNDNERLTVYKNRPVKYIHSYPCYERPDGKGWERIWFPDGGPENARLEDVQCDEEKYDEEQVREVYRRFADKGAFDLGSMPGVAPRREWVGYDF